VPTIWPPIQNPLAILLVAISSRQGARKLPPLCVIAERSQNGRELVFTSFDPVAGCGRELLRYDADPIVLQALYWAPGGKGLFVSSVRKQNSVLLYVDLHGNTRDLWELPGEQDGGNDVYAVPSPDGHRLAIRAWSINSNKTSNVPTTVAATSHPGRLFVVGPSRGTTAKRCESVSRFSRCKSARMSAACW